MSDYLLIFPTVYEAKKVFATYSKHKVEVGAEIVFEAAGKTFTALVSGIGCPASAERVRIACERHNPKFAILSGFCGACDPSLKNGDCIFESESSELDAAFESIAARRARIAFFPAIAERADKEHLFGNGFSGVEMESELFEAAINSVSSKCKFFHFRCVSDSAESKISKEFFDSFMNTETGKTRLGTRSFFLMLNPVTLFNLIKFAIETAPAAKVYDAKISALILN